MMVSMARAISNPNCKMRNSIFTPVKLLSFIGVFITTITVTIPHVTVNAQSAIEAWRFSQRDMNVGVRMTGMSIRGFAGFGDHGALYSNPAGLGYINDTQLIVSLRGQSTTGDSWRDQSGFDRSGARFRTDGFFPGQVSSSEETFQLGDLAFLYDVPVRQGKMVAGVSLSLVRDFSSRLEFIGENTQSSISSSFLPYDNEYTVDENGNLDQLDDLSFAAFNSGIIEYFRELYEDGKYPFLSAVIPGTSIDQSGLITGSGGIYELSGGIAWQASKTIMTGISLNVTFGRYDFDRSFNESDVLNENTSQAYNVLNDDDSLFEGFDQLNYNQTLDLEMTGFNFRAGMSAKVSEMMQIGVSIESPTWTYIEESYSEIFSTSFDLGGTLSYGDLPEDLGNGFYEYSMRSPWRLGAGVQFDFGNLTVTGEAEILDWGQLELSSDDDQNAFSNVNGVIEDEFGLAVNFAVGAELELGRTALRVGFSGRPSPYSINGQSNLTDAYTDNQLGASFGVGYMISQSIRLDLGVQFSESIPDLWEIYPSDAGGPRQDTIFEIDHIQNNNVILFGITMDI